MVRAGPGSLLEPYDAETPCHNSSIVLGSIAALSRLQGFQKGSQPMNKGNRSLVILILHYFLGIDTHANIRNRNPLQSLSW